jgi:hypothetical protein
VTVGLYDERDRGWELALPLNDLPGTEAVGRRSRRDHITTRRDHVTTRRGRRLTLTRAEPTHGPCAGFPTEGTHTRADGMPDDGGLTFAA